MSDEDRKLLEAVKNWRPPEELHPIAMDTFGLYAAAEMKWTNPVEENVRAMLNTYGDDLIGLAEALEGLTRFMMLMQEKYEDQEGTARCANLMREYTPLFEPFWQRVGEALANQGDEAVGQFQAFLDNTQESLKKAPTYGEKAPQGSVPLKDLLSPGRPPPWAPKSKK